MAGSSDVAGNGEGRNESISELLDGLIVHMNTTREIFTMLIISSLILAPISIIIGGIFITHPQFLHAYFVRLPDLGYMIVGYIGFSIAFAAIWLFVGIKERGFFSQWNERFKRYMKLREYIDKELAG